TQRSRKPPFVPSLRYESCRRWPAIHFHASYATSVSIHSRLASREGRTGELPERREVVSVNPCYAAGILFHHALLSNADIVTAGVLHHVHHLVGLTDDFMCALCIFWVTRYAHAGSDIERNVLDIECRRPHHVAQTFGDDHC